MPTIRDALSRITGRSPVPQDTPATAATGAAPAKPKDVFLAAVKATPVQPSELQAVKRMRELVGSGKLGDYYRAYIGTLDDAAMKAEAEAIFSALPKLNGQATAVDFVAYGLWTQPPKNVELMERSARYLPGRQVFVKTTVDARAAEARGTFKSTEHGREVTLHNLQPRASFLAYQEGGTPAITYRATLVGEQGENFLVKVDGREEPLAVPRAEIFELNQPGEWLGDKPTSDVDYSEPLLKAKVAEAAIKMDALVGQIDFTKVASGSRVGRIFGGRGAEKTVELQRKCVGIVHDCIDMEYPLAAPSQPRKPTAPRDDADAATQAEYKRALASYERALPGYEREKQAYEREKARRSKEGYKYGGGAGRQAVRGEGVCSDQAEVMLGVLLPFRDALGVDVQVINGSCYRHLRKTPDANPFSGPGHSWLQLTYRPSMEIRIVDRTWQQSDKQVDLAYGLGGDRYPRSRSKAQPITETDVNLSGDVSVATLERQFPQLGVDGRENHMSLNWRPGADD